MIPRNKSDADSKLLPSPTFIPKDHHPQSDDRRQPLRNSALHHRRHRTDRLLPRIGRNSTAATGPAVLRPGRTISGASIALHTDNGDGTVASEEWEEEQTIVL